jgi:hypothetical protein
VGRAGGSGGVNITLHIERLILDGVAVSDGHGAQVRDVVGQELHRLLSNAKLADNWVSQSTADSLEATPIDIPQTMTTAHLGQQIAAALYGVVFT